MISDFNYDEQESHIVIKHETHGIVEIREIKLNEKIPPNHMDYIRVRDELFRVTSSKVLFDDDHNRYLYIFNITDVDFNPVETEIGDLYELFNDIADKLPDDSDPNYGADKFREALDILDNTPENK